MVARLKHSDGLATFYRDGARHVQALTGFDRVMVYRFDTDDHGEVVAEALRGSRESYFGLHYPASDIPPQARALYLRTPFRIIADVASAPVPIESTAEARGERLDQSLSVLRAVSPVHIEYLKNMGVGASLSISIIVDGRLWGLFACHHPRARLPSFAYRTAAELFGEMFSMMLEGRLRREAAAHEARDRALAALLVAEMEHDGQLLGNPARLGELIYDTLPAEGLAVHLDGAVLLTGTTPDPEQCTAIVTILVERGQHGVFACDTLGALLPAASSYAAQVSGFIAIPLMRGPNDYLLLFRPERVTTVQWAGDPEKIAAAAAGDGRLTPRLSFAAWAELVHGRCEPFTPAERNAAETIRIALLEALLQSTGERKSVGVPIRSGQDMLIAELNHRVRNILALIRGLISQTRSASETTDGFITNLDERVQSLARAHDQITSDRWGPARLADLIDTEAAAYLGVRRDRVTRTGPNILVHPTAFTTLALVFHELMTNAAKYGALSSSGTVLIEWRVDALGDLIVHWLERDGPAVTPPSRRGFGSTIIERSIPHDLGGTAELAYAATGFVAHFRIPERHLAGLSAVETERGAAAAILDDAMPLIGATVLLVEDNMIIALDCAETLKSLGATSVTTAASVDEALAAIEAQDFHFALLDFNLGTETSAGIAELLETLAIPFAFATGYDGQLQDRGHANAPVVGKPYGRKQLAPLLVRLGFGKQM
jgi:light-regulated signal transduction histidine kinase (bacteriophytochrome)